MSIFLALVPDNTQEVHVVWEGHTTIDSAKAELNQIRSMMMKDNKIPMDCYVYEADKPPFGLPTHKLDDVDFNFYREKTPEELAAAEKRFNEAMKLLKDTKDPIARMEELAANIKNKVVEVDTKKAENNA